MAEFGKYLSHLSICSKYFANKCSFRCPVLLAFQTEECFLLSLVPLCQLVIRALLKARYLLCFGLGRGLTNGRPITSVGQVWFIQ